STANTIGTNADGVSDTYERNLISGNSDEGIVLIGSSNNKIKGNYIGTTKTGLVGLPNYINGGTAISTGQIVLKSTSTNNIIGTDGDGVNDAIEGNIIGSATIAGAGASSYSDAIDIITSSTGNRVAGNLVGIGADGVTALNILTSGVTVNDYAININANNNTVGTNGDGVSDALEANYVGNSGSAIVLDNVTGCVVAGNYCGLGTNKTTAATLGYSGIYVINSSSNRIGSSASNTLERNYVCNSSQYGIWVDGSATANNDLNNIRYNMVGLRPDGVSTNIGKTGIYVFDQSNADTIQYNTITRCGTSAATGTYPGIQIGGSNANEQSTNIVVKNNTIYKNIGGGVYVVNNSSLTNKISQNSIYNNGNGSDATGKLKLGIDLAANGVTANDALDPDTGPNGLANFPIVTGVAAGSSCAATIAGTYNGLASTQYYVEVYSNDVCNGDTSGVDYYGTAGSNYGEGKTYVGTSSTFTTDASGNGNWSLGITFSSVAGKYITAVAIQNNNAAVNSTSEFSQCYFLSADYGDAPDSYSTLTASCGPIHVNVNSNLRIGSTVGAGSDGQPSVAANLDTYDDGVSSFPVISTKSTTYSISSIPVNNTTGSAATLYAWIDFNRNGVFESSEFTSVAVPSLGAQNVNLTWNLASFTCASTLVEGNTYLRMRLTTTSLTDNVGTSSIDERCQGVAA
ncbi:MAG TPA: right-handed parallel beta-helix repeat-containing protein, partial [Ferruginibacter sp.]|nr:right-handed parallel beta-helix repeat-containing protein [Ferruginibacter sp.]